MPIKKPKRSQRKLSLRKLVLKNNHKLSTPVPLVPVEDKKQSVEITKKGRFTITTLKNQSGAGKPKLTPKCRKCSGTKTYNTKTKRCLSKKSQKGRKIEKCKKGKISKVMTEYRTKQLKNPQGMKVSNQKQAIAIALSVACKSC